MGGDRRHYEFQARAIDALAKADRTLLVSPTGSGKTYMAVRAAILSGKKNILWVAPTIEICQQARNAWQGAQGGAGGRAFTAKCAAGLDGREGGGYDLVIFDECHHVSSQSWRSYAMKAIESGITIWGLTATPKHRDQERNLRINQIFPHKITVDLQEVLDSGLIILPSVIFWDWGRDMAEKQNIEDAVSKARWVAANSWLRGKSRELEEYVQRQNWILSYKAIEEDKQKIRLLCRLIREAGNGEQGGSKTLVLCNRLEHAKLILHHIFGEEHYREATKYLVHGKLTKKVRQSRLDAFSEGRNTLIIATSLADEGLDLPSAETLILAGASHSKTKIPQRIGRVMRGFGEKQAMVHDFIDRICPIGKAMSRNRWREMRAMGIMPEIRISRD